MILPNKITKNNSLNIELKNAYSKVSFILIFNDNESNFKFYSDDSYDSNSLYSISTIIGGGRGMYYTNITDNISLQEREAFGKKYIIEKRINDFNWEFYNETKTIGGFICYKAKTLKKIYIAQDEFITKTIEVWYSKELPFLFGSLGYSNLPGLILELKEGNTSYKLQEINFGSFIEILKPQEGEIISEIDFEILAKKFFEKIKL